MFLINYCGSNKFSLEKILFLIKKFFIYLSYISKDNFVKNKIYFCSIKLFCIKKNNLYFQFNNNGYYNNFLLYNKFLFLKLLNFEKNFVFVSDYGMFFSKLFINSNYIVLNYHISKLPIFRGLNPTIGMIYYINKLFYFTLFIINNKIDDGKINRAYKFSKNFIINYFIVKYNFSIIYSLLIYNIYKYLIFNFFYCFNQIYYYKYNFNMTG